MFQTYYRRDLHRTQNPIAKLLWPVIPGEKSEGFARDEHQRGGGNMQKDA